MIKSFLILAISVLVFTSCTKRYSCDCTYVYEWGDGTSTEQDYSFEITGKKSAANEECTNYQEEQSNWRYTYDCELNAK